MHFGGEVSGEVVTVDADVELAERHLRALDLLDLLSQALGEQIAARDDADEREVVRALVGLEDLMRDAHQRALDLVCVHADVLDRPCVSHTHPFSSRVRTDRHVFRESRRVFRPARTLTPCRKA